MIELHYYNWTTHKDEIIQLPKDHIVQNAQVGNYINVASYIDKSNEQSNEFFVRKIREIVYERDVKKIIMSSNFK